jgi:lycopene cyclase domain-containing protein
MKWLYLLLDIGTFLGPFFLSFENNVRYRFAWKNSLLSAVIIAIPFLVWDFYFTSNGFWGFNHEYILGIYIFNLPIEEVLFFIVVPFACTFIYEVTKYYFSKVNLQWLNRLFYMAIPSYALLLTFIGDIGYYTVSVIISSTLVLFWLLKNSNLKFVAISFMLSLIPFFLMNGVLTGGMTEAPVVWYNELQKVEPRLWTIPMEDVLYSFTLLVANIILFEKLQQRKLV